MNTCPICETAVDHSSSRDFRDKHRVSCPRCGEYEISGSALAMIGNRLASDPAVAARLSHAVYYSVAKSSELFMVTSANLDDLISNPLPGVDQQLDNLLNWLANRLGDDPLGNVELPDAGHLAAMVGTIDNRRVSRLISYATQENLIENRSGSTLSVTPKGWRRIEPEPELSIEPDQEPRVMPNGNEEKIIEANCNKCGGERNSFERAKFGKPGTDGPISWETTISVLECCGCGELSILHEFWFSEWDEFGSDPVTGEPIMVPGIRRTNWPSISKRQKPNWVDRIDDEAIRSVLDEVYLALDHDLATLAAMGTRTLLDQTMLNAVGDVSGGFRGKLNAMVIAGRLGEDEKETFLAMIDVGNAAAHRGFVPNASTLDRVLSATESLLQREFVLRADAEAVRNDTPTKGSNA